MGQRDEEILAVGCVYGQYSSLDEFSYDAIRYVGMTGTTKDHCTAQDIANKRLKAQLGEDAEKSGNPARFEWYGAVAAKGGHIISHVLVEVHDTTRSALGDIEHDWIEKLGGPVAPDGTIIQLFNLTHGRDGGWWTQRDEIWVEAARERMVQRYATEEARLAHGAVVRQMYADRPELREHLSELQKEIQNRPDRLEQNRKSSLANWQRPEYRAKQEVDRECEFCGRILKSHRLWGSHVKRCKKNPDRDPGTPCMYCQKTYLDIAHHEPRCKQNLDRIMAPRGPREKTPCPICGIECGVGAGLRAHVKWNHEQPSGGQK